MLDPSLQVRCGCVIKPFTKLVFTDFSAPAYSQAKHSCQVGGRLSLEIWGRRPDVWRQSQILYSIPDFSQTYSRQRTVRISLWDTPLPKKVKCLFLKFLIFIQNLLNLSQMCLTVFVYRLGCDNKSYKSFEDPAAIGFNFPLFPVALTSHTWRLLWKKPQNDR